MPAPLSFLLGNTLKRPGDAVDQWACRRLPNELPGVGQLIAAYTHGLITYDQLIWCCQSQGVLIDDKLASNNLLPPSSAAGLANVWQRIVRDARPTLSEKELLELRLRVPGFHSDYVAGMNRLGYLDPQVIQRKLDLTDQLVSLPQWVTWAGGGILDPLFVDRWKLNAGYPQDVSDQAGPVGMNYTPNLAGYNATTFPSPTIGQLFWHAHWAMPGVQSIQAMSYRLRGKLGLPGTPRDPSGLILSGSDYSGLMDAANIPQSLRPYYEAIALSPVSIRIAQRLYDAGIADRDEVKEIGLDNGLHQAAAEQFARTVESRQDVQRLAQQTKAVEEGLKKAWHAGTLSDSAFLLQWHRLGLSTPAAIAAWGKLTPQQQQLDADNDPVARGELASLQMHRAAALAEKVIESKKKEYLKGLLPIANARNDLTAYGLDSAAVQQLTDEWQQEFTGPHRELSAGEILSGFRYGYINPITAQARLGHIGYNPADAALLLTGETRLIALDQAHVLQQLAKTLQQQVKAAQQQVKAAQQAAEAAQKQLLKNGTPGDLLNWMKKQLLTPQQYAQRMGALGFGPDKIRLDVDEAAQEIAAKAAAAAARAQAQAQRQAAAAAKAAAAAAKANQPPKPKVSHPSAGVLGKWLKKGIIAKSDYEANMATLGFDPADIADFEAAL